MGETTAIAWCDATFNPWWGCQRVSPGCEYCYAETFAKRTGHDIWGPEQTTERRFFDAAHWREPLRWNAKAEAEGVRRRVFCASMADVFEDRRDLDEPRARLFELIEETPGLDWLLLTKRPENMVRLQPAGWLWSWPLNVWAGTTVESQEWAEARIPHLLNVPAAVRFLSCEPLLGPIDLHPRPRRDMCLHCGGGPDDPHIGHPYRTDGVSWVIVGGESAGPIERRLVHKLNGITDIYAGRDTSIWAPTAQGLEWVRSLRDQCQAAGVPLFFKQWGGPHPHSGGRLLDGREWNEFPESKGVAAV